MNRKLDTRAWTIGGIVAAVVVAAAGWFLVVSPVRSDTESVRAQTANAQLQNAVAGKKVHDLARDQAQIGTLTAKLRAALEALPMENGLPEFTRQLTAQAKARGVSLDSVTVGGFSPANGAGSATSSSSSSSSSSSDTGTTSGTGTDATTTTASTGTVAIQVTVSSTGPVARQMAFLHSIQVQGPRRALVTNVSLGTAAEVGATSVATGCAMTAQLTLFATPMSTAARTAIEKLLELK